MSRGGWHFPDLAVWQFGRLQLIVTAPLDAVGTTLPDTGDVGVIEAGGESGFSLECFQVLGVVCDGLIDNLDGDHTVQDGIPGPVDRSLATSGYPLKDFISADMPRANLSGKDLTGANLDGVYLSKADLSEANLCDAYLTGANLREADLRYANLDDVIGADFTGARNVPENYLKR